MSPRVGMSMDSGTVAGNRKVFRRNQTALNGGKNSNGIKELLKGSLETKKVTSTKRAEIRVLWSFRDRSANNWEDCGSAKHGTIRRHHSWGLLTPTSLKKVRCFIIL